MVLKKEEKVNQKKIMMEKKRNDRFNQKERKKEGYLRFNVRSQK